MSPKDPLAAKDSDQVGFLGQVEKALRDSEERLRLMFESIGEGIIVTDLSGKITQANSAAARLHGFDRGPDMVGVNAFDLIARKDLARARRNLNRARGDRRSRTLEYTLLRKNRHRFSAELSAAALKDRDGNPQGFIAVVRDITERKRAQEALRRSEEKYKVLFESRLHGAVVIDQNMKMLMVNKAAARMFGFESPEEALDINIFDYLAPEERERARTLIRDHMFRQSRREINEIRTLSRSGDNIWIETEGVRTEYQGKMVGLIAFRDVTERKQAEAQFLTYQKELRSLASQLALAEERERRRIATEIHDRATQTLALCSIKMGALLQSPDSRGIASPLGDIHAMIKQLIAETRSLTFQISSPLLYEVGLEAALEHLTEQVEKEHGLRCHFEDDGQLIPLPDEVRVMLFQATRELLVNAAKHSRAANVWVQIKKHDSHIQVTVRDDGAGFDASRVEPGRKTVSGFGLFSIRERVRNIGGSLNIESTPGLGTRATLAAPLSDTEHPKEAK